MSKENGGNPNTVIVTDPATLEKIVAGAVEKGVRKYIESNKIKQWPDLMTTRQAAEYLVTLGHKQFKDKRRLYTQKQSGAINTERRKEGATILYPKAELDKWSKGQFGEKVTANGNGKS